MKKEIKFIRHGDVGLHPISELPKDLKKIEHNGIFIVAFGEMTGHCHRLITKEKENLEILQDKDGRYYIQIKGDGVEIEHWNTLTQSPAEHKPLPLIAPFYKVDYEEDYNPITEELFRTQD